MRFVVLAAACAVIYAQPLWFEPNQGQAHPAVQFIAHTPAGYVYFADDKMAVRDVRMNLIGANKHAKAELEEPTGGISSYFIGRDEKDWHTGIPHYGRVRYKNVYAGIDLVYYASGRDIEYDFVLKPGADPSPVKLAYNKPVQIDSNGDLLVAGLRQHRPKVFQNNHEIECNYLVREQRVQLALADYDRSQSLTIDPVLDFSTYIGGPGDESANGVALDASGFIYATGGTQSPQAPTLDPFQQPSVVSLAPFVLKMSPDGSKIVYFAVLGRNGWDNSQGIVVDQAGSAVVIGNTRSTDFPLKNPIQAQLTAAYDNAFFAKLSPDGKSLVYSTYFGGTYFDLPYAVALDSQGNAFYTGLTLSTTFPILNPYQAQNRGGADCFLAKVSPAGSLIFSTLFGGSGSDDCYAISMDKSDNAYIVGRSDSTDLPLRNAIQTMPSPRNGLSTPMLLKFSPTGVPLIATFFGGPVVGEADAISLDGGGNIFVAGSVSQPDFITKNAFQDTIGGPTNGFLVKFSQDLTLLFSTFLGGSGNVSVRALAVDSAASAYLAGQVSSADFPVKNSLQSFRGGGPTNSDAFVTKFTPSGNALVYSTFLGGSSQDSAAAVAVDRTGVAYIIGITESPDFPTVRAYEPMPGGGRDAFLVKLSDNTPLPQSPLVPNPGRLLFRYTQGTPVPAVQTVTVGGPAFTVSTSTPWLNVTASASSLTISVDPTGLAPNTYNASVSLIPQADTPASIDVTLTVLSPAPVLTSVDPTLVPIGSGTTAITIHGSGFSKDTTAQVDGISYMSVSYIDQNTLRITLPQNYFTVQYNHTIAVKNPTSDLSNVLSVAVGTPPPQFTASGIVNAASFAGGPVSPGEIVTVFGTNLTDKVTFDSIPATLVFASPTQVNVTVPYIVTGRTTMIQVGSSVPVKLDLAPSAPGIFAAFPASDNILTLYATGCGALTNDDLPRCALPVSVTVNAQPATVLYAGIAPGLVQGANQINVQLPDGIPSGQLTIILTAGDASSKPFVWSQP